MQLCSTLVVGFLFVFDSFWKWGEEPECHWPAAVSWGLSLPSWLSSSGVQRLGLSSSPACLPLTKDCITNCSFLLYSILKGFGVIFLYSSWAAGSFEFKASFTSLKFKMFYYFTTKCLLRLLQLSNILPVFYICLLLVICSSYSCLHCRQYIALKFLRYHVSRCFTKLICICNNLII